jgi:hypothetical protein
VASVRRSLMASRTFFRIPPSKSFASNILILTLTWPHGSGRAVQFIGGPSSGMQQSAPASWPLSDLPFQSVVSPRQITCTCTSSTTTAALPKKKEVLEMEGRRRRVNDDGREERNNEIPRFGPSHSWHRKERLYQLTTLFLNNLCVQP